MQADEESSYSSSETSQHEESSGDEYIPAPLSRTAKKKRTSKPSKNAPARTKKSKYEGFTALPLEIVSEICRCTDFATLYALAHVNTCFSALLSSTSSEFIWDQARHNSDISKLTATDFSLVQLAELLFGGKCDCCGKSTSGVSLALRVRCCSACAKEQIVPETRLLPFFHRRTTCCLPSRARSKWGETQECYLPHVTEMSSLLQKAQRDGKDNERRFIDNMVLAKSQWDQDLKALAKWDTALSCAKWDDRASIKAARQADIEQRLRADGWGDEDFAPRSWERNKFVNVAKPLSTRAWNSIKPALEQFLTSEKAKRVANDLKNARNTRLQQVRKQYATLVAGGEPLGSYAGPLPSRQEFEELDCIKLLWDPEDAIFDETSTLVDVLPSLAQEIDDKIKTLKEGLFALLLATLQAGTTPPTLPADFPEFPPYSPNIVDALLGRPSSLFDCRGGPFTFAVLAHHSSIPRGAPQPLRHDSPSLEISSYRVSGDCMRFVQQLVQIADLEEESVTKEDLDAIGNGFICESCKPSLDSVCRTWKQMTVHVVENHQPYSYHAAPMVLLQASLQVSLLREREEILARLQKLSEEQVGMKGIDRW